MEEGSNETGHFLDLCELRIDFVSQFLTFSQKTSRHSRTLDMTLNQFIGIQVRCVTG